MVKFILRLITTPRLLEFSSMRKEITIDLHGVESEIDVILRFEEKLGLRHGGLGWSKNSSPIWDAFIDDMRDLDDTVGLQNGDELVLYVGGINDVKSRGLKTKAGEDMVPFLSEILLELSDPSVGPDTFKLFPQYVLK